MPAEILLVVADETLRQVLTIALAGDGSTIQPVADAAAARATLATHTPDLLLLDGTMRLPLAPAVWADRYAPGVPLLLLAPPWDDGAPAGRPDRRVLRMPFGLDALRKAVTGARNGRARRLRAAPAAPTATTN
jgi:CheY-like chemotaxis protein